MATYTFTTSDLQEDTLTDHRLTVNAARGALTPPLPPYDTNDALVQDAVVNAILGPLVTAYVDKRVQKVANAYRVASDVDRKVVDGTLKV